MRTLKNVSFRGAIFSGEKDIVAIRNSAIRQTTQILHNYYVMLFFKGNGHVNKIGFKTVIKNNNIILQSRV